MSESSLRELIVLPFLVYPYFELDNEQDEIHKTLLIKQETEWIEWLCSFLLVPTSYWESIRQGTFIRASNTILTA